MPTGANETELLGSLCPQVTFQSLPLTDTSQLMHSRDQNS